MKKRKVDRIKTMLKKVSKIQEFIQRKTCTYVFANKGFHIYLVLIDGKKLQYLAHDVVNGITEEYFLEQLAKIGKTKDKIEEVDLIYGYTLSKEELKSLIQVIN